jgi:hypothetical protein
VAKVREECEATFIARLNSLDEVVVTHSPPVCGPEFAPEDQDLRRLLRDGLAALKTVTVSA